MPLVREAFEFYSDFPEALIKLIKKINIETVKVLNIKESNNEGDTDLKLEALRNELDIFLEKKFTEEKDKTAIRCFANLIKELMIC